MSLGKSFEVGKIINTHGLHGHLKIYPTTDKVNRFDLLEKVFVDDVEYAVESVRYHKNFVYLKLAGIDDISDAEKLRNKSIKIPDDMALPLDEGEYYMRDLYGMKVYEMKVCEEEEEKEGKEKKEEKEEFLGHITDIIQTGANDVYVVDDKLLIPAIKKCILDINVDEKIMKVDLEQIKGLRELNA